MCIYIIYRYQSEGFTPNGDISFLGALGNGVGSGIGGSSSAAAVVRDLVENSPDLVTNSPD